MANCLDRPRKAYHVSCVMKSTDSLLLSRLSPDYMMDSKRIGGKNRDELKLHKVFICGLLVDQRNR